MIESWIYIWQQSYRLCWRTGYEVREKNSKVPGLISWKERAAIYRDGIDCGRGLGVREFSLAYIHLGIPISHAKTCHVETNWEMAKALGQIVWDLKRSKYRASHIAKKKKISGQGGWRKGKKGTWKWTSRWKDIPSSLGPVVLGYLAAFLDSVSHLFYICSRNLYHQLIAVSPWSLECLSATTCFVCSSIWPL